MMRFVPLRFLTLLAILALELPPAAAGGAVPGERGLNDPPPKSIIFVCGGDAGMARKQVGLREQLNKAISKLKPPQTYNIIFMQGATPIMLRKDGPLLANDENRKKAAAFIENIKLVPTTQTAPSVTAALKQKPELMYLLTNADIKDKAELLKAIKTLNKPDANGVPPVRINTIAFVDEKDTGTEFKKTLKQISDENDGTFVLVSEE
jgi:hypothetical protein